MSILNKTPSFHDRQSFPVDVLNEQDYVDIDEDKIKFICSKIISDAGFRTGRLGVVLTDNITIHALNCKYLGHDYVTDVISFNVDFDESHLEAEVVVSAEMAQYRCIEFGMDQEMELLLYVIHGTLHQVGFNDKTKCDAQIMRQMETAYLALLDQLTSEES
jgi:probable rRNA maturation factor